MQIHMQVHMQVIMQIFYNLIFFNHFIILEYACAYVGIYVDSYPSGE
jgi:hypothetical protein